MLPSAYRILKMCFAPLCLQCLTSIRQNLYAVTSVYLRNSLHLCNMFYNPNLDCYCIVKTVMKYYSHAFCEENCHLVLINESCPYPPVASGCVEIQEPVVLSGRNLKITSAL